MKSKETKEQFIRLRAEGLSYAKISEQLNISKSTCSSWEKELADKITEMKHERLQELYDEYGMAKEARIRQLGTVLQKIDKAIEEKDFSEMTPAQLLDARMKYQKALNEEYVPNKVVSPDVSMAELQSRLLTLANQAKNNELNEQSAKELQALTLVVNQTYCEKRKEHNDHALGLDLIDMV